MKKRKRILNATIHISGRRLVSILFFMPIILSVVGLFFIFEASSVSAFRNYGDSFHYLKLQSVWLVVGIIAMIFFSRFNYKYLYTLAVPALIGTIIALILVIIPHIANPVMGARRWISIGGFNFQPTEFAKLSIILYLASWFQKREKHRFIPFGVLMLFLIALIMAQPDLGTATIIVLLSVSMYFLAGENMLYMIGATPFALAGLYLLISTSEYRMKRLMTFINPNLDTQGISYHLNQILISLSAGGLLGRGFSESRQKYQFLPEAHTDSIFAIVGEELGFLGALGLVLAYVYLIYVLYRVTKACPDRFGHLLSGAFLSVVTLQVVINLGAMVSLLPLTGVPLPFISYGGSSLLVFYILSGIVINIALKNKI